MRRISTFTAAGLLAVLLVGGNVAADLRPAPQADVAESECGQYGTTVEFVGSPSEAARKALKEEKLVMVLHVSGNFEDPDFT